MYSTFTRMWGPVNPDQRKGLERFRGDRIFRSYYRTEEEAITACKQWNATYDPGKLDSLMEYEEVNND